MLLYTRFYGSEQRSDEPIRRLKAGTYGLKVGAVWCILGIILAAGYFVYVYRSIGGKVALGKHGDD
jgi:hypothetical protein